MKISRKGILAVALTAVMVLLLVLHMAFRTQVTDGDNTYMELTGLFDMDSEISLSNWYSSVVLLFVPAVLLFFVGWQKRRTGQPQSWSWFALSGLFLFLSIDDAAMIHEKLSTFNRVIGLQGWLDTLDADLFAWSWWVVYLPIAAVLAVVLARWFARLPRRTKTFVVVAIGLAVAGQVGMEIVSGFVTNSSGEYIGPVWRGLQKFIGRLGLSLFLFAIIEYIWSDPNLSKTLKSVVDNQ